MRNHIYFITIVEEGNISKAAEKLYITQPSLSKYLKKLEEEIGYELIDRNTRPLIPTEHGKIFYNYLQENIERQTQLEQDLASTSTTIRGTINLGLTFWRSSILVPFIIPHFKERYPQIEFNLYEGSHQFLMSMLNSGQIEFSLIHTPNPYSGIKYEFVMKENLLLLVNKDNPILGSIDHKLNKVNQISEETFLKFMDEEFISMKSGQNIRDQQDNYFSSIGVKPQIMLETSNIVTAKRIVDFGRGVAFAPALTLVNANNYKNIVFFKIDTPRLCWNLEFGFREDYKISRPVRLFIDFVKEKITKISDIDYRGSNY